MQEQAKGLREGFVTKVAERVPAQRAAYVRVHLNVPALLLQRTSRLVVLESDGTAAVEQEFNFQLTAPAASVEMRVGPPDPSPLCSTPVFATVTDGMTALHAPHTQVGYTFAGAGCVQSSQSGLRCSQEGLELLFAVQQLQNSMVSALVSRSCRVGCMCLQEPQA